MKPEMPIPSYVLITPARNEAQFIELTIQSVIQQTVRPLKWVVASDGSTDGTDEIVERYAQQHDWIELVRVPEHASRNFAGKVRAFNAGYARVADLDFEVLANLDGDVSFDETYLAFLVSKFSENPRLGVAGTPYREENAAHDETFKNPDHVSGACQMFRRQCFEEIGGYAAVESGGIDLIALLAAQAKGWQTRRYDERFCFHHRNVGSGNYANILQRLLARGRKDYQLGSHPIFEIFRSMNQMRTRPYLIGGVLMMAGYSWAMLRRVKRTMPSELRTLRQRDQMQRLGDAFTAPFRRTGLRLDRAASKK